MEKYVERFGYTGSWHWLTLDNRLVCLRASNNIVGLDGENFLQNVAGTEGFECPDLHLTETLTTKLCLTAKRPLSDKTVRADRARVHLVLNHVAKLKEVGDTNSSRLVEHLTCLTVVEVS